MHILINSKTQVIQFKAKILKLQRIPKDLEITDKISSG